MCCIGLAAQSPTRVHHPGGAAEHPIVTPPDPMRTLLRTTRRLSATLVAGLALLTSACATDTPATAPAFNDPAAADVGLTATEYARLVVQRDSILTSYEAQRAALRPQFEQLRETSELLGILPQLPIVGNLLQFLRCAPTELGVGAEIIGPQGGRLQVGPHSLVIPAGALKQPTLVYGVAPMGILVNVIFGTHGLQFAKPATLSLSYSHCQNVPSGKFRIVYVNGQLQILETPPSTDIRNQKRVEAKIDHFSSYMIAY